MAEEARDIAISAVGINKVFNPGTDEEVIALQDINLAVEAGEFISLIGPSGCGKSTLMRLIGDLLSPTAGELTVNGKQPNQAQLDRDYGMVFQAATLYDWRSVIKNVQLPLEVMGYSKDERQKLALLCWIWLSWVISPITIPGSFLAACSSASLLRGRWHLIRPCCLWTSHSARWMNSRASA